MNPLLGVTFSGHICRSIRFIMWSLIAFGIMLQQWTLATKNFLKGRRRNGTFCCCHQPRLGIVQSLGSLGIGPTSSVISQSEEIRFGVVSLVRNGRTSLVSVDHHGVLSLLVLKLIRVTFLQLRQLIFFFLLNPRKCPVGNSV